MLSLRTRRVAALALLALLALLLSGCGLGGAATAPTAIPAATQPAGQPTSVAAQPTAAAGQPTTIVVATPADAQPGAARPTFSFEPRVGGPGTTISLRGWGFAPNATVKIGVGFPAYTGGPLGTTNANARGEWQTQVTLPNTQPSPGPDWSKMLLIALDGGDKALASAPFGYIVDAQPAPPTAVPPTVVPARPIIGFTPSEGTAGTTVSAFGTGYAPGKAVAIRLGIPQPMGEVLAVGNIDADGRWSASFVMPDRLPSGDAVPAGKIYLVAMDEQNKALASAPFTYHQASEPLPALARSATEAVERFLTTVQADRSGRRSLPYAGGQLREAIERQVLDLGGVLKEQNPFTGFRVDGEVAQATPFVYVRATLLYGSDASGEAARIFTVSDREGGWRVFEVSLDVNSPPPPPPAQGDGWQVAMSGDFNGDGVAETLRYRPSALAMQDGFGHSALDSNAIAVSAVEVLQDGAHGPWAWVQANGDGVWAGDRQLAAIASDARPQGAAAFRFALGSGAGPLFFILPLDENGRAFTQAISIIWDAGAHEYRIHGN